MLSTVLSDGRNSRWEQPRFWLSVIFRILQIKLFSLISTSIAITFRLQLQLENLRAHIVLFSKIIEFKLYFVLKVAAHFVSAKVQLQYYYSQIEKYTRKVSLYSEVYITESRL